MSQSILNQSVVPVSVHKDVILNTQQTATYSALTISDVNDSRISRISKPIAILLMIHYSVTVLTFVTLQGSVHCTV